MHFNIKAATYRWWLAALAGFPTCAYAQEETIQAIESLPLQVSAARTVSLSFAGAIKALDRGSPELLAQKAKGTDNVVLLKAARKDIQPTSLIVITSDGDIHTFEVQYQDQPHSLGLQIQPKHAQQLAARISDGISQKKIEQEISLALIQEPNLKRKAASGLISLTAEGLFISGPVIYLKLSLENHSVIDYDIASLRIFTVDKKQIKRSASQQEQLPLIGKSSHFDQLKASEQKTLVVALAKTTLPKSKNLVIELREDGGWRHINVSLKARHLSKITAISTQSNF